MQSARCAGEPQVAANVRAVTENPACACQDGRHACSSSQPGRRKGCIPRVPRLLDGSGSRPEAPDRRGAHGRRLRQSRQDRHGRRGLSEAADLPRHRRPARRRDGREGAAVLHDQGRRRGLPAQSLSRQGRQPAHGRRRRHDRQQLGRYHDDLRQQRPAGGVRRQRQADRFRPAQAAHIDHRSERQRPSCVDGRAKPTGSTTPGTASR